MNDPEPPSSPTSGSWPTAETAPPFIDRSGNFWSVHGPHPIGYWWDESAHRLIRGIAGYDYWIGAPGSGAYSVPVAMGPPLPPVPAPAPPPALAPAPPPSAPTNPNPTPPTQPGPPPTHDTGLLGTIEDAIGNVLSPIIAPVHDTVVAIESTVGSIDTGLGDLARGLLQRLETAETAAVGAISQPLDAVARGIGDAAGTIGSIGQELKDQVEKIPAELASGVKAGLATALNDVIDPLVKGAEGTASIAKESATGALDAAGQAIDVLLKEWGPIEPEQVAGRAIEFLAIATAAEVGAHFVAVSGEAVYPTKNLGLSHLAGLIGKFSAYDPVVEAITHSAAKLGIGKPLEYVYKRRFRPIIPPEHLLRELLVKRVISSDVYARQMQYHGMTDEWIAREQQIAFRELHVRDLVLAAQAAPLDPELVHRVLEKQGFDDDAVRLLEPAVLARPTQDERSAYKALATQLFDQGLIDQDQLREAYTLAGVDDAWIDRLVLLRQVEADRAIVAEEQKTLEEYYNDDLIGDDELRAGLTDLKIRPRIVEAIVQRLSAKKNKKTTATTAAAARKARAAQTMDEVLALEELYADDQVTDDELRAQLAQLLGDAVAANARAQKLIVAKARRDKASKARLLDRAARADARARRQEIVDAARAERAQLTTAEKAKRAELLEAKDAFSLPDIEGGFKDGILSLDEADQLLAAKGVTDAARSLKLQHWIAQLEKASAPKKTKTSSSPVSS